MLKYPNLRAEMTRRGYKLEDLAKIIEVGVPAISQKLNGNRDFGTDEIKLICNHFNLPFEYLFNESIIQK